MATRRSRGVTSGARSVAGLSTHRAPARGVRAATRSLARSIRSRSSVSRPRTSGLTTTHSVARATATPHRVAVAKPKVYGRPAKRLGIGASQSKRMVRTGGIHWGGRVFNTKRGFSGWLRQHGSSYKQFSARHAQAAQGLGMRSRGFVKAHGATSHSGKAYVVRGHARKSGSLAGLKHSRPKKYGAVRVVAGRLVRARGGQRSM